MYYFCLTKTYILLLLVINSLNVYSQTFKGKIVDENNNGISNVTIKINNQKQSYFKTDTLGFFSITPFFKNKVKDSIKFEHIGYKTIIIPINQLISSAKDSVVIVMKGAYSQLLQVTIIGNNINEEFTIKKLSKYDIYNNPNATADPLKAITFLPFSTTLNELANPSLRGSDPDRTGVIFNGVSIINPVRNSQLSGLGNFSLFNNELIEQTIVYASNPPVTYNNSTSGAIALETKNKLSLKEFQGSISIANVGFFADIPFKKRSFIQFYTNLQFDKPFLFINKISMKRLIKFGSKDLGANLRLNLSEHTYINIFNYSISELYNFNINTLSFQGETAFRNIRDFYVLNFNYNKNRSQFMINIGGDFSKTRSLFLNTDINTIKNYNSLSLSYKIDFDKTFSIEFGQDLNLYSTKFKGKEPYNFFLQNLNDLKKIDTNINNNNSNIFFYVKRKTNNYKWIFGAGFRYNPFKDSIKNNLALQGNIRFQPSVNHSFLISSGIYNQYINPTALNKNIVRLTSFQLAFDYELSFNNIKIQAAIYKKLENDFQLLFGDKYEQLKRRIYGVELFFSNKFLRNFEASFSNTYLNVKDSFGGLRYKGFNNLPFFMKFRVMYNNLNFATISLAYLIRPGVYFTPIIADKLLTYNSNNNYIIPIFGVYNSEKLNGYSTLDLSINKLFKLKQNQLIIYANVTNILNLDNVSSVYYNYDYSKRFFDFFQKRTIYFGFVFKI